MRNPLPDKLLEYRLKPCNGMDFAMKKLLEVTKANLGFFVIPIIDDNGKYVLRAKATVHAGWDHVSVSREDGIIPTWENMCLIKNMFFSEDEYVVQYHPAKEHYVNLHPGVLHLWRPQNVELPKPPVELVI